MRAYVHVRRWGVTGDGLDPLINRIARNLLIDRHRRVAPHLVPLDSAEDVGDPAADPTEEVIRRQRSHEVRSAVSELPDRHQTALLYSLGGMTPAEVGDKLGIGRNAADALLHRARRSLRDRLRHVGEGAFGVVFWVKIRVRDAAARAGFGVPVEAAGAATGSVAAAVAIVAAMSVVAPLSGGSEGRLSASPVVSVAATEPVSAGGGRVAPMGATVPGEQPEDGVTRFGIPGGPTVEKGDRRIRGNADIDNPAAPDQKLLGVGPDVIHQKNEASAAGTAFDSACKGRETTCNAIYQDPRGDDGEDR